MRLFYGRDYGLVVWKRARGLSPILLTRLSELGQPTLPTALFSVPDAECALERSNFYLICIFKEDLLIEIAGNAEGLIG